MPSAFARSAALFGVLSVLPITVAAGQAVDAELEQVLGGKAIAGPVAAAPYFGDRIALGVLPSMIAVHTEAGQDVGAALGAVGLGAARVQPSGVPGWQYVMMPEGQATLGAAELAVDRLAERVGMASLVYLGDGGLPVIPTRDLLVRFRDGTPERVQAGVLAAHGAVIVERDTAGTAGLVRARTGARTGTEMLETALSVNEHKAVQWAQSDRIFWVRRYGTPPNDPLFAQQWALEQASDEDMDALAAWDITIGDESVRVVVLDSGTQQNHPDISQVAGRTFTGSGSGGNPANDCDNHGTAVAGCISATMNNAVGVVGIAPGTRVQAAKIFNEIEFLFFCLPFLESQDSWTVAGINWAASSGARVTNSSWGGGAASAAITSAFNSTRDQGVLHIAAAGNDGSSTIGFPANLGSVNAVAALAPSGNLASFSTYGSGLFISAPGAGILTTDRTGGDGYSGADTTTIDGTSFASPYTAGVAALVLSVNPALAPSEVEDILAQTAADKGAPGYDTTFGWGFVNAGAAVVAAGGGGDCPTDWDGNGVVNAVDVGAFLSDYFLDLLNGSLVTDFDGNGVVNAADVGSFLSEYFSSIGDCS